MKLTFKQFTFADTDGANTWQATIQPFKAGVQGSIIVWFDDNGHAEIVSNDSVLAQGEFSPVSQEQMEHRITKWAAQYFVHLGNSFKNF